MQEVCIDQEFISSIGIASLIDTVSKFRFESLLTERKIYTGGISGISILPSTYITYEKRIDIRSVGHSLYRYREYTTESAENPNILPSLIMYSRSFRYRNYSKLDIKAVMEVSLTTTMFPDGRREEGASICISLQHKENKGDIDALVSHILGMMYKLKIDKPAIIPMMSSTIAHWRPQIPSYKRLSWMDVSMNLFSQSIIISPPMGERVFYIRSPHGTFLLDGWNRITPIDTNVSSSLTMILGIYSDVFYPTDIYIDKDVDVRTRSYSDRMYMIKEYNLPSIPILENPQTPADFYSFVVGKKSMIIFSPTTTFLWEDIVLVRIYVAAGGIPMALSNNGLTPIASISGLPSHAGDIVEVSKGKVISTSIRPSPMTIARVESLMQLDEDPIRMDDLSGRTCTLFSKYLEKTISLLYSYYASIGVTEILDISSNIGHSYWRTPNITTYAISPTPEIARFVKESSAADEGSQIIGYNWEVDIVDEDLPIVDAVNIIKTAVTIDELDIYSSTSNSFISMMIGDIEYTKIKDHLISWDWNLDSEYSLSEELLPIDKKCIEHLTLYIWRKKKIRPETVRLIYTPIRQGIISKLESPYGTLYRIGTAGSTTSGTDDSLLESIYTASSPQFRRMDKIGKTLYVLSNRIPRLDVPLYIIPPDSWSMYKVEGSHTYIYNDATPRDKGIVLFKNKGHWEPLAKRSLSGELVYIW